MCGHYIWDMADTNYAAEALARLHTEAAAQRDHLAEEVMRLRAELADTQRELAEARALLRPAGEMAAWGGE